MALAGFTDGQVTFIERLAGDTGLDSGVVAAWCLAEESGGAAQSRQAAGNHNWLNIGYFDSGAGTIAFNGAFLDPREGADQTANFLKGKWGGASAGIRGILSTVGQPPGTQIARIQSSGWASSGYPSLPSIYGSLSPSAKAALGAGVAAGGTAGLGGTGTSPNDKPKSAFTIGDVSNPNEDYWTGTNRLAQDRQWYYFSDGETLYLADGPDLMAQDPALTLDIHADRKRIHSLTGTFDNTAFQYAVNHRKRQKTARKTQLAKIVSPVQLTLEVICDIDEVRGGDVVQISGLGPGDGKWLVGDCRRSVFQIYSELTLVPALSPLTEQQVAGANSANTVSGAAASKPGAGTVIAAMISAAATINNQHLPYVWAGGHGQVGTPSSGSPGPGFNGRSVGYDCSGAVAAVLRAGGLWKAASVGAETDIIGTLTGAGILVSGQGNGSPEVTLFDEPGVHIYMRLDGKYWGTSGSNPGGGAGWIENGSARGGFNAFHIPQALLTKPAV